MITLKRRTEESNEDWNRRIGILCKIAEISSDDVEQVTTLADYDVYILHLVDGSQIKVPGIKVVQHGIK